MRWIVSLFLVLAALGPAYADTIAPSDQLAIRGVITAQIQAFRRNDGPAAYSYAAPGIRAHFPDASHFLAMVRAAYPAVFRPRSYSFGSLEPEPDQAGILVQKVEFFGPDGDASQALYSMQHEPDGRWLIAGCALVTNKRVAM
ncbi:DUF4864 domain-containing protein [Lichenicoccus sp.]|uniref:DUF4864 domain-containing protein n=1 Tax=Lichenicoccus sp. TaxID=2781899 RepID=UPI003D099047